MNEKFNDNFHRYFKSKGKTKENFQLFQLINKVQIKKMVQFVQLTGKVFNGHSIENVNRICSKIIVVYLKSATLDFIVSV